MNFENTFNIGDIIGGISLIVGIISLFLINPIYKHFKIKNNSINTGDVVVNGGNPYINQNIVYMPKNEKDNLVINDGNNE